MKNSSIKDYKLLLANAEFNMTPNEESEIQLFEKTENILIPADLREFLVEVGGTGSKYDPNFFRFNSIAELKRVHVLLEDWQGPPNYIDIKSTVPDYMNYFIFADYEFHLISYAIFLSSHSDRQNTILAICGDVAVTVSKNFFEFLEKYLRDHSQLLI